MTEGKWCKTCQEHISDDEIELECMYPDCPIAGSRHLAHVRASEAKRRMDEARAVLEKAEDEWHQACLECDGLDGLNGELQPE